MGTINLTYPVRFRVIAKYFGQLCIILSALTLVTFTVALIFSEYLTALRYAIVSGFCLGIGIYFSKLKTPYNLQPNEGMALVVLIFVFTSLIMTYPIMNSKIGFVDAFFEITSAISATGLSMLNTVEHLPSSFIFDRAWIGWYGSLGFVTLALALVMQPGLASRILGGNEKKEDDLVGGTQAHARNLMKAYCALTCIVILGNYILGLNLYDALLYGLAAISTSGYSPTDSGLGGLSCQLQVWLCTACLAGAIPLSIYYRWKQKNRYFNADLRQMQALFIICLLFFISIALCMYFNSNLNLSHIMYEASLLIIQTQTTTGFDTISYGNLDAPVKLLLIISMLLGGSVGSTAGGIKILRLLIVMKIFSVLLQRMSMPRHAVIQQKFAGLPLDSESALAPLLLFLLYVLTVLLSWFIFIIYGYDPLDSLFEVVGYISSAGITVGITNASLPAFLKLVFCVDMLVGRLEIFAWLVLLYPSTWFGVKMERI